MRFRSDSVTFPFRIESITCFCPAVGCAFAPAGTISHTLASYLSTHAEPERTESFGHDCASTPGGAARPSTIPNAPTTPTLENLLMTPPVCGEALPVVRPAAPPAVDPPRSLRSIPLVDLTRKDLRRIWGEHREALLSEFHRCEYPRPPAGRPNSSTDAATSAEVDRSGRSCAP